MIITFKQHVFTITAIFAALGLGMMIGSSIIGEEGLLLEQRKIIENIRYDIDQLTTEKKELISELSTIEDQLINRIAMEEKIFAIALNDFLEEKNYYILYHNIENDKLAELENLLNIMGGKIDYFEHENLNSYDIFEVKSNYNLIIWNVGEEKGFSEIAEDKFIKYQDTCTLGLLYNIIKDEFDDK
ncbi:copper transporter [Natronospora cellulosivora (SeqCode)]